MGTALTANLESKKRRLMSLVDSSAEPWRKVVFYSNDEAIGIVTQLYQRWELHGRKGDPLDYATEEEVDRLLLVAERIEPGDMKDQQTRMLIAALYGEEALETRTRQRGGRLRRVLRKIFFLE